MAEQGGLPGYDDLPVEANKPAGSSWGVWGDNDVFGCLNLLTPERVVAAASLIRTGAVFSLNLEMHLPDPPLFGRPAFSHDVSGPVGGTGHDEQLHSWNTQSSSQWDGFRHVGHPVHGFYGGVPDELHGMHFWASRGLAGRAVLADVAKYRADQGRPVRADESDPIETADIDGALRAQGTKIEPGDILLIRTGWLAWYRTLDADGRKGHAQSFRATGLRPGEATAAWLWNQHIAAVAADNPALEVWPPGALATPEQAEAARQDPSARSEIFMHFRLLPLLGLPIGELWDLEALAQHCVSDGRYECFFTSAPINLKAGVASPPNALAIK